MVPTCPSAPSVWPRRGRSRKTDRVVPAFRSDNFPMQSAANPLKRKAEAVPGDADTFVPSSKWSGARPGYVFKKGPTGLGYYLDNYKSKGGKAASGTLPKSAPVAAQPKSVAPAVRPPSSTAKAPSQKAPVALPSKPTIVAKSSAPPPAKKTSAPKDDLFRPANDSDDEDDDVYDGSEEVGDEDDDGDDEDASAATPAPDATSEATFASLGLCDPLVTACHRLGWKKPSEIQVQALPPALQGLATIYD
jgi:hypothetical protein